MFERNVEIIYTFPTHEKVKTETEIWFSLYPVLVLSVNLPALYVLKAPFPWEHSIMEIIIVCIVFGNLQKQTAITVK